MPSDTPSEPPSFWNSGRGSAFSVVLLITAIGAVYSHTLRVPFLLDDMDSIGSNASIRSFATALFPPGDSGITVSGRPLLNLSLAVNHALHGTRLEGYHLANMAIHAAAALTLFGLVRRTLRLPLFAEGAGRHATPLALVIAGLWALHPLQTESVTYVIQRAESLVGLFYLLTLYAFVRGTGEPGRIWSALAIASCLSGMATKEVMASAPLVVLLYDRTFVSGTFRESWRRHRRLHLCLGSAWLLLGFLVLASGSRGASVGYTSITAMDYALTQAYALVQYLKLSFWPACLVFDYGATVEKRPLVLLACMAVVLPLAALSMVALRRKPVAGFIGSTFFLILAPTTSFVPVATQTMAEHRMYLPLAALVVAVAAFIYKARPWLAFTAGPVLAVALGFATWQRNITYGTAEAIWADTVRKAPDNVRALNNLAVIHLENNHADKAIPLLRDAVGLVPGFAMARCNLGRALIRQFLDESGRGRLAADMTEGADFGKPPTEATEASLSSRAQEGLACLEKAVELEPLNARFHAHLGNALLSLNRPEAALAKLQHAISLDPQSRDTHFDLANILSRLDRNEEAAAHYRTALELDPDEPEAITNFGALLRRMGMLRESVEMLRKAVRLAPQSPRTHSNLGVSLLESGASEEGIKELREALRLHPGLPQALYNLSNALAETGQTEEAILHLETLLAVTKPTAELVSNLGVLHARAGNNLRAVEETERALRIDPDYAPARENLEKLLRHLHRTP